MTSCAWLGRKVEFNGILVELYVGTCTFSFSLNGSTDTISSPLPPNYLFTFDLAGEPGYFCGGRDDDDFSPIVYR